MAGVLGTTACQTTSERKPATRPMLSSSDIALLDSLERSAALFFTEAAHPETGLVMDRKLADGEPDPRTIGSIAATGFGLSVLCVAHQRGYADRTQTERQVERTLVWLATQQPTEHGFFYHFFHWGTGQRIWKCELSSIDSAILFMGAIHARNYFGQNPVIQSATSKILDRADWPWFCNGKSTVSMGWKPESGFLESHWDHYCELMMLYVLGIGSPTHALPTDSWEAWTKPTRRFAGETFVWSPAPLFVHQFSHAWIPFQQQRIQGMDWFENSIQATRAHLQWSLDHRDRFPHWSRDFWGVTSSDSEKGYVGWGGPPDSGPLDGTIVPCASAGSLPFLPTDCLRTLRAQREYKGGMLWKRYGFVDAWNPHTGWINPDVIGIDVGISALMAANLRDGHVWNHVAKDPVVRRALRRLG